MMTKETAFRALQGACSRRAVSVWSASERETRVTQET